jgi:ADP-heptose:LPS heptosyltransferase
MRLLVIRTSAMGDVALTLPVLKGMSEKYPDVEIILVTRKSFEQIFISVENLQFFFPDFTGRHKGFPGLIRLYRDIRGSGRVDHVLDLHDVLRSKMLMEFFTFSGIPVSVIDKGRKEKGLLVTGKESRKLKHTVERYKDVFLKAGFDPDITKGPWIVPSPYTVSAVIGKTGLTKGLNIGIAPYAVHNLKVWPEEQMISLMHLICDKHPARFWLFGGKEERDRLNILEERIPGSFNVAGKLTFPEELALISQLDFMISMDSANMHLAALTGIKVISLWGGTDPLAGFSAWQQPDDFAVRIPVEELICRPCTVYGKGECKRGDFACMNWLTTEKVFQRIEENGLLDL